MSMKPHASSSTSERSNLGAVPAIDPSGLR